MKEQNKIKRIGPDKGGHWEVVEEFVESGSRSFTYRQEGDIKRYMNGQSDKEEAAGTVYKASLPFLKADECERVKGQLSDIAKDMKEERQQTRSLGLSLSSLLLDFHIPTSRNPLHSCRS